MARMVSELRHMLGKAFVLSIAALALAACAQQVERAAFPDLSYGHLGAMRLDVARIEIVDNVRMPLRDPHVEHRAPVAPGAAAVRWVRDRLAATGASTRRAVFTIERGDIVETVLERTKGVRGVFTTDQSERYDANLKVRLEIFDAAGRRLAEVEGSAERNRTVPEDITLNDREKVWFEMVEALMRDFNQEMEAGIGRFMTAYLR